MRVTGEGSRNHKRHNRVKAMVKALVHALMVKDMQWGELTGELRFCSGRPRCRESSVGAWCGWRKVAVLALQSSRPIRDFGGWGWRSGRGGVQAFTVKGSSGVCLTMRDGKRDLIGSERREERLRVLQPRGIAG